MDADLSFLQREEADYFHKPARYRGSNAPGLTAAVVDEISRANRDPDWLRELRHTAYAAWHTLEMPGAWAPSALAGLDFARLRYFLQPDETPTDNWRQLSAPVRETFEELGVRREQESFLGGLKAQFDADIVFSSLNRELARQGVVFVDPVTGLRDYPELFRDAFASLVPYHSNKFAALNMAVFSGGAFVYVPPGVKVSMPLKSYFRINAAGCGQFGRTLIVVDEGAELTFMEGCSAARHETASLHASVGEIIARRNASIQYITFQNWSRQVFNLVQMRSIAHAGAHVKWLDCNVGGKLTMKYPATILQGAGARAETISIGFATTGQHQDTGAKMLHRAPHTASSIISKSISVGDGQASYRGLVEVDPAASRCRNNTECDALLLNTGSRTATYPAITVRGDASSVQHEASVSKISANQIFYMRQRGLSENEAVSLSVNGFINDLVREFPIEYSAPLRRLLDMEMEGSVG